jgi:hypothetical protein
MPNLVGNTINDIVKIEIDVFGHKRYTLNGLIHRVDGPAIEYSDGAKHWYIRGKRHRENGPAVECNGDRFWYQNGKLHSIHGPAVEYANGQKEWWIIGLQHPRSKYHKDIKISWLKEGF